MKNPLTTSLSGPGKTFYVTELWWSQMPTFDKSLKKVDVCLEVLVSQNTYLISW